ncbi:hypothetical protein VRRI112168_05040 [Vreelandella rituensis]
MAFRFQRRITLAPGIRLNLSKRGIGFSVGPRGASVSIGPSGAHAHAGIPGSGLAYRTKLNTTRGRSDSRGSTASLATSALAERLGQGETLALTLKVNSDGNSYRTTVTVHSAWRTTFRAVEPIKKWSGNPGRLDETTIQSIL